MCREGGTAYGLRMKASEKRYASNTNDGEERGRQSSTSEEEPRMQERCNCRREQHGSWRKSSAGGVDEMDVTSRKPQKDEMLVPKAVKP